MKRLAFAVHLLAASSCSPSDDWRIEEPAVSQTTRYRPAEVAHGVMANGVGVYCSPFSHPATTRVALVFGHGYADDGDEFGRARMFARWLSFEARDPQVAQFEQLGAEVQTHVLPTATVLEVDVLHADASAAIDALVGLVQQVGDEVAYEAARRDMQAELAYTRRTPSRLVDLAARQSALRGSAPSVTRRGHGSAASLRRARFEDSIALRDQWIGSTPLSVAVVGPHSFEDVLGWTRTAVASWPPRGPARQFATSSPRSPKTIIVVPVADLDPATVFVGTTVPPESRGAYPAYRFGRWFANDQLREDLQRTYGVGGGFEELGGESFAFATARVPAPDAYKSAVSIAAAFRRSRRYVNDATLQGVLRSDATSWTASKMETEARATGLYKAISLSRDPEAAPPFGPIARASVEEVRASLASEFSYDGMQIIIAGDLEQLRYALRGTTFQVWTHEDLLGPVVSSETLPSAEPAPATSNAVEADAPGEQPPPAPPQPGPQTLTDSPPKGRG